MDKNKASSAPQCSFGKMNAAKLGLQAGVCIATQNVVPCAKMVTTYVTNPCVQEHMMYQTVSDPFYSNMPTGNLSAAINYSVSLGGEDHDPLIAMGGLFSK